MTPNGAHPVNNREALDLDVLRYWAMIRRRWLLISLIMLGSVGLSVVFSFLRPSVYQADAKLLVKADRTPMLTGLGEGVGELDPLVNAQNPLSTEVAVITSRPVLEQVIDRLNLRDGKGNPLSPKDLQDRIEAKILAGADIIQLSFVHENPDLAVQVVNTLADIYIENNIDGNRAQTTKALQLIEQRLPESEAFVSQSEVALRNFKENNNVISLDAEASSTVEILKGLETQALSTSVDLDEATARANQLQQNLGLSVQQALLVSELSQAPAVQGALQELQALERQKSIELGFFTEEGPVVQKYQAQINSLKRLLQEELAVIVGSGSVDRRFWQIGESQQTLIMNFVEAETVRLALAQRLAALQSAMAVYQVRGDELPRLEQKQAQLERKLEVARSSYQTLLQRLQELQAAENQAVDNVQLIEPAVAPEAPTSGKKIILLLGVGAGAFIATSAVAILEIVEFLRQKNALRSTPRPELTIPPQASPARKH